jgi:ATP-binding cassette subfamily B (MDR/TAP) protein 1
MGLDSVFREQFESSANEALKMGSRGAPVEGCTYGVASALIYFAEALLFYTGAVLIAKGTYTYLQMVEVLNLVVFTVTIGSQMLAFSMSLFQSWPTLTDRQQRKRLLNRPKLPVTLTD